MEIKVNTIITLSNQDNYVVLNETFYEDNRYFLVMGIDDAKEIIQSNVGIFKEEVDGKDVYVSKVEDSSLIIELTNLLKSQL